MYAIFDNGNKQYKACVGDTVKLEKLNAEVGANVTFPAVLTADENGVKCGADVAGVMVNCEVVAHGKNKKIIVFKYKAKKNERKKQGHRQPYTTVKVTSIDAPAQKKRVTRAKKAEVAEATAEEAKAE